MITLKARGIHRISDGAGITITCLTGALWITQEADHRDITLQKGERFALDREGLALLYALEPASFELRAAGRVRPGISRPAAPVPERPSQPRAA
jgi:hypothetical protein